MKSRKVYTDLISNSNIGTERQNTFRCSEAEGIQNFEFYHIITKKKIIVIQYIETFKIAVKRSKSKTKYELIFLLLFIITL